MSSYKGAQGVDFLQDAQYSEKQIAQARYIRHYRGVSVVWGVFSVILTILLIVVFTQPQWIGEVSDSPGRGYFGPYSYCYQHGKSSEATALKCVGNWKDFNTILNGPFKATTVFLGVSCLSYILICACLLLFFFVDAPVVFMICAWIQALGSLCVFLACVVFPAGWGDNEEIAIVCGSRTDDYKRDTCEIRWVYILAIILIFDSIVLCVLAFLLAIRYKPLLSIFRFSPLPYNQGGLSTLGRSELYLRDDKHMSPVGDNMSLRSMRSARSRQHQNDMRF